MDLSIFEISDPSGRFSKESFLIKNYPDEHEFITQFCKSNNLENIPFKEKVYLCINNLYKLPQCKNSNCLI
jgi:hypothetical protein